MGFLSEVWSFRKILTVVLTPVVLLPIPLGIGSLESTAAYGIIVMAVYWISEALPISVTSLLPLLIFPVLGVAPAKTLAKQYVNDTTMLYIGGLMVALAVETCHLHKRMALRILLLFGPEPKRLLLGLMLTTWFLSMWISNTATTAMMLPIADAILKQLKGRGAETEEDDDDEEEEEEEEKHYNGQYESLGEAVDIERQRFVLPAVTAVEVIDSPTEGNSTNPDEEHMDSCAMSSHRVQPDSPAYSRLCKAVCLSIAYSANVGGMATITGTGPNLVLKGQSNQLFNSVGLPPALTFANWMGFAVPLSASCLVFIWVWLILFQLRMWHPRHWWPCSKRWTMSKNSSSSSQNYHTTTTTTTTAVRKTLAKELKALGPLRFAEVSVSVCFVSLVLLWITRDLQDAGGWKLLFKDSYLTDATPAVMFAILLFILPSRVAGCGGSSSSSSDSCSDGSSSSSSSPLPCPPIMNWKVVDAKFNWGTTLLLGASFAISYVTKDSGLSDLISRSLTTMSGMNSLALNLCLGLIVALMTEVTSNTATATILMPIMAQMAISMGTHPLYLMLTAALSCSFAFMLPIATPSNAIVFTRGHLKVSDMVCVGVLINVACVLLLVIFLHTWGRVIFPLDTLPAAFLPHTTQHQHHHHHHQQ